MVQLGLVLVDRNTVLVVPCDVSISFGAHPVEIPGRVRFMHPLHNFALVSYNPQELPQEVRPCAPPSLPEGPGRPWRALPCPALVPLPRPTPPRLGCTPQPRPGLRPHPACPAYCPRPRARSGLRSSLPTRPSSAGTR